MEGGDLSIYRSGAMITAMVWTFIVDILTKFWMWIAGAAIAVLVFLFSPTIRKYTIGIIAVLALGAIVWLWGYNSNHTVEVITHSCDEFRKWLVTGTATDKAIAIFQRHDLCV